MKPDAAATQNISVVTLDTHPLPEPLSTSTVKDSLVRVLDEAALFTIADELGNIVYANTAFLQVSKYKLADIVGKNYRILNPGEYDEQFYQGLWQTLVAGKRWRSELKNKASDGNFFWTDTVIAPVLGEGSEPTHFVSVSFLIGKRKELEEKLTEKNKELAESKEEVTTNSLELQRVRSATLNLLEDLDQEKAAVEQKVKDRTEELVHERNKLLQVTSNIRGGAILVDHTRTAVFVNRSARLLLELPDTLDDETVFKTFLEKFGGTEIQTFFDTCPVGETLTVPEAEIGSHVFEIFFHGLEDADKEGKNQPMYFILFTDITEAKLLERSKSELVAVASHQLRTPLTAMRGNVEMLLDGSFGEVSKEQQELLHDIEESTIRLITMVNEMLDITKIEKGDLEMSLEEVDPTEVIDSIVADLADYALRHEFVVNHHKPEQPVRVYVDKVRVRQVLQNIIDNAIKYSQHPGTLDIGYEIKEASVTFSFADNGIGIPLAEQSKMFGRFYRASNTARTTSSGSGLGLYIVRSIVEQFGGSITFESTENVGTTFFITLPTVEGAKQKDDHDQ